MSEVSLVRSHYFARNAAFRIGTDQRLLVHDLARPRVITMDDWPELVFMAADGSRTISQYLDELREMYEGAPPAELEACVMYQLDSLLNEGLIVLHEQPIELPDNLLKPMPA